MRLLRFIGTLFAASVLIFLLMRAVPGNPARVALGVNATDEAVDKLTHSMGLDRPLIAQYAEWMKGLFTGHFGISLSSQQDITPLVLDRAQVTLLLIVLAIALALAGAIPMGLLLARFRLPVLNAVTQLGIAVPSFLAGILLVAVFSVHLGWLPANGWQLPREGLSHLVLPVISLALVQGAMLTRYVRATLVEEIDKDYIRTARAMGESRTEALVRHGLRNAALPVLTVTGVQLSTLVVGAVVIENVFVLPGLGSMLLSAVSSRDLITVQTLIMVFVTFTLTVNLLTDAAYRLIDPRLKEAR